MMSILIIYLHLSSQIIYFVSENVDWVSFFFKIDGSVLTFETIISDLEVVTLESEKRFHVIAASWSWDYVTLWW
jgi:hypothetical protein